MGSAGSPPIILFHYPFSPWSQKVTAYLNLRGIPWTSCEQPVTLPRPNMQQLGVKYRRIPVLSIGRDIYCDTLIMLEKLKELNPLKSDEPLVDAQEPQDRALERLLEKWTDVVVFKFAAAAIPTSFSVMGDKNFTDDRKELWGREWTKDHQDSLRAEALAVLRSNMEFMENDLLSDGREWIFKASKGPALADVHAAWIFQWLAFDIPEAFPENIISAKQFPKCYAWFERYRAALKAAAEKMEKEGKISKIDGDDAVKQICEGPFGDKDVHVDELDPTGIKAGEQVHGYPIDTGFTRKDVGTLSGLTTQETVISVKAESGQEIRVHHPRWNFAVEKI